MNPRPPDQELERLYCDRNDEGVIDFYMRTATPTVLDGYDKKLQWIERLLPGKGRLLDFGCGAGYFFERALKRGWDAHGVDLGSWAKKAAADRGLPNLHIGHLSDLQFPDHHFDVIYAAQVFEHLPAPLHELAALKRILRPGGLLYVDVPNDHTLPIMLGVDDFELNLPPQHLNYFTPTTIRSLLRRGGFDVLHTGTEGGLKWENLFGRRIRSEIAEATKPRASDGAAARPGENSRAGANWAKRLIAPPAKRALYGWGKLGISLYCIARRPA